MLFYLVVGVVSSMIGLLSILLYIKGEKHASQK